jgi:hypothetical protein
MKILTVLYFIVISTVVFSQKTMRDTINYNIIKDTALVVIPLDTNKSWSWRLKKCSPLSKKTLSNKKIDSLLSIVNMAISKYNRSIDSNILGHIDINKYVFQIVGGMSPNGEEIFWINAICKHHIFEQEVKWQNSIIQINDGGKCFFNLKVNLSLGSSSDFFVNGF